VARSPLQRASTTIIGALLPSVKRKRKEAKRKKATRQD
jgi:hypothetical protein